MWGLSFDIALDKSELPIFVGCDSVHVSVQTDVTGDIHPLTPGAADSLRVLSMQYILRLERDSIECHPYNLAHVGVKLHIPSSPPRLKSV